MVERPRNRRIETPAGPVTVYRDTDGRWRWARVDSPDRSTFSPTSYATADEAAAEFE